MRRIGYVSVAVTLVIAGLFTAFAVSGTTTTGTVTACVTVPAQTISANSVRVGVVAAKGACTTVSYTVPTTTETVTTTVATTTPPVTTTATVPVTTTAPATTTQPPPQATVYVSTTGNDSGSCGQAAPCKTLQRGYDIAADGGTVSVAAGVYPPQTVDVGTGKHVVFLGQKGAVVRALDNSASNVTFDGIDCDANFAQDSCFENHGSPGANNVTYRNASIGNVTDEKGALVSGDNFTFDNVVFHDVLLVTAGVHNECLYAIVVPGMVIRNSTFQNCATMDVFFTYGSWWTPLPPAYGNVTLDGNRFFHSTCSGCAGQPAGWHYYGLYIGDVGGPMTGWTIRNNWFENDVNAYPVDAGTNTFCGNTGRVPDPAWSQACK